MFELIDVPTPFGIFPKLYIKPLRMETIYTTGKMVFTGEPYLDPDRSPFPYPYQIEFDLAQFRQAAGVGGDFLPVYCQQMADEVRAAMLAEGSEN